jgi:ferric-dicitrate binding protein FerR (iron transport regulator)
MGKARQRAGESLFSLQDAVDWLVENTSEGELDLTILSRWKRWSGNPRNRAAHAGIIELEQQLRQLSPACIPSSAALLADAAAEGRQTRSAAALERVK